MYNRWAFSVKIRHRMKVNLHMRYWNEGSKDEAIGGVTLSRTNKKLSCRWQRALCLPKRQLFVLFATLEEYCWAPVSPIRISHECAAGAAGTAKRFARVLKTVQSQYVLSRQITVVYSLCLVKRFLRFEKQLRCTMRHRLLQFTCSHRDANDSSS